MKKIIQLLIFCLIFFVALSPLSCFAQTGGWNLGNYSTTGLPGGTLFNIVVSIMNWLLAILGVIAIIAFSISGIQYLLSAGNEQQAETAKRNMKWSIIGVAVALSGLIIIQAMHMMLTGTAFPEDI